MNSKLRSELAKIILCTLLLTASHAGNAQGSPRPRSVFLTTSPTKIAGISIGLAAVGAGVGLGIYFAVHHKHNLTGCAATTANGLNLVTDGDKQTYALSGEIAGIKSGERVRVSGNKSARDPTGQRRFAVERLSKDFGTCKVLAATP
jgi:hypothetical protein